MGQSGEMDNVQNFSPNKDIQFCSVCQVSQTVTTSKQF